MNRVLWSLVVAGVAFAVYANTLGHQFVVDDHHQIEGNAWVTQSAKLGEVFTHGVWDFEGRPSNFYRPAMYVWYRAVDAVVGPAPWAYHLLNVLLHVGASVLVFLIAARLLAPPAGKASLWLPASAALLFAVHPIHTEPVAWSAAIVDLGCALFCLLSFYLYVSAEDRSRLRVALAALSFLVAMLHKEPAVTFVLVLVAYELGYRRDQLSTRVLARRLWPFAAVFAAYLALRIPALGGFAPQRFGVDISAWGAVLAALDLFSRYLMALAFPVQLNFWHVYDPPTTLLSARMALALSIDAAFVWLAFVAWRRGGALLVGVAALVAPLLPALHVMALNRGVAAAFTERYAYTPSFGFVLLAAAAAGALLTWRPAATPIAAAALAIVVPSFATATVLRNRVWKDDLTLWSDAVQQSPQSGFAHVALGHALAKAGQRDPSREEFLRGLALDPTILDRDIDKGIAFSNAGLTSKAIFQFHGVLRMAPWSARAHYQLARAYERAGWRDAATAEYGTALQLEPSMAAAHNDLGVLHAEAGRLAQALPHFQAAVALDPSNAAYRENLARSRAR